MEASFKNAGVVFDRDVDIITESKRKKPNIAYAKLVVPLRMRSVYWKYFGFPANEEKKIITGDVIICLLCRHQMLYNRNTSNLRMHLKSRHKDVLSKLDSEVASNPSPPTKKPRLRKQLQMDDSSGEADLSDITIVDMNASKLMKRCPSEDANDATISVIFPDGGDYSPSKLVSGESKDLCDTILNFIVCDLISPDIVQGDGFQRLLTAFSFKAISIPHENKLVTELIPGLYALKKQELQESIISGGITNLSLSIEQFSCVDGSISFSIFAHFIKNAEPKVQTRLLSTFPLSTCAVDNGFFEAVERILNNWSINLNAVSAVVVNTMDEAVKMQFTSRGVTVLPCFLSAMQNLCSRYFKFPMVADLLYRCQETAKLVVEHQIDEDPILEDDEDILEQSDVVFAIDQPDLWLTTYYMMLGLLRRKKNIIESLDASQECSLTASKWRSIVELVNFLQPIKAVVVNILEEKSAPVSLVHPLKVQLVQTFLEADAAADSSLVKKLKQSGKEYLDEVYGAAEDTRKLLEMATLLDPRFKSSLLSTNDDDDNDEVDDHHELDAGDSASSSLLVCAMNELVQNDGLIDEEIVHDSPTSSKRCCSSGRSSGINALLGSFQSTKKCAVSPEDRVRSEIQFYETTAEAAIEEAPLEWWQSIRARCPNMVRLASKYLCIPACIYWHGQTDIEEYLRFHNRRAAMKVTFLDMLLFLHLNQMD